jgi:hypothetical protein
LLKKQNALRRAPEGTSVDTACSADPKLTAQRDPDTTKSVRPQAPDDRGESDYAFFSRRPGINSRIRLPFAGEFPPCVLEPGRAAFVYVTIERDRAGNPGTRARAIFYSDIEGGRA